MNLNNKILKICAKVFVINMAFAPEKPLAEEFLLRKPLICGVVKVQDIRYIMDDDIRALKDLMHDRHKDDPIFKELLRPALLSFPRFKRLLEGEVNEEEARNIASAYYHTHKWSDLVYTMQISGFPSFTKMTSNRSRRRFAITYAIACLLEPHKALVKETLLALRNSDLIYSRFRRSLKEGTQIDQKESGEFMEFIDEYLYAEFIFLFFSAELVQMSVT